MAPKVNQSIVIWRHQNEALHCFARPLRKLLRESTAAYSNAIEIEYQRILDDHTWLQVDFFGEESNIQVFIDRMAVVDGIIMMEG